MALNKLKNKLLKEYKYRIELHAHTSPASGCSQITPKKMPSVSTCDKCGGYIIEGHTHLCD